ncbi:MAG: hypothetical protein M1830_006286, partial [Pleopsidium flavum]
VPSYIQTLRALQELTASLVSGGAGIGLETTIYLAEKGCTVYVASRNQEKSEKGIAKGEARLNGKGGPIKFHHLDLSTIEGSLKSADEFTRIESRLDIIIGNAGISMTYMDELSVDGWEKTFATNHLGHFAFVTNLLGLVEKTATKYGEARIVMTSSRGYMVASKLDYDALRTPIEGNGSSIWHMGGSFFRYCNTKLANIYFMAELDRRLQERGIKNVYCNSCHPGSVAETGMGKGQKSLGPYLEEAIRGVIHLFCNSVEDAAKTQVYLAASKQIRVKNVHGEYWAPTWTWTQAYNGSQKQKLIVLAENEREEKKLWEVSEEAINKATAPDRIRSAI